MQPPWMVKCDQCGGRFDSRATAMTTVQNAAPLINGDKTYCPRCYGKIYGFAQGLRWVPLPDQMPEFYGRDES